MKQVDTRAAVISVFIIFFISGYWYIILPKVKVLGELINENVTLGANSSTTGLSKTNTDNSLNDTSVLANELMPSVDSQYDLTIQVEALAKNTGITLTAYTMVSAPVSLGPKTTATVSEDGNTAAATSTPKVASTANPAVSTAANAASKVTVNMSIAGTYAGIQQFVLGLHQLERMIQIDQLTVTGTGGSTTSTGGTSLTGTPTPSSSQLTAQIVAFAYYLP